MKIIIINLDKGIFSSGSKSLERLKHYSQLVDRLFVIVWTLEKYEPIIFQDRLYVYPTNSCGRFFYYIDTIKMALKIIKKYKIDLIFTQDPFETGLAGWFIAKIKKIPLQLQVHTDFLSPYFSQQSFLNKIRVCLASLLIPQATTIRVVSERIKRSILLKFKFIASKIFVLPILVDVQSIKGAAITTDLHKKYPQFDFLILSAGRLSTEKNIALAVNAVSKVHKQYPKVGLLVVGNGSEEKSLRYIVKSKKLSDIVKFEPWTTEIFSYFKTADLFLLPSNYEGYGLTVVEALVVGCPVIMTDVGCAGEFVQNECGALIVPVNDVDALSKAILKMIRNRELTKYDTTCGLERLGMLNSVEKYYSLYRECLYVNLK